jgi:tetratricopeptide (TPR) repeat protein
MTSYGTVVHAQIPVSIDASDPDTGADPISARNGFPPLNYAGLPSPAQPSAQPGLQQNDSFAFPNEDADEPNGPISVAELQHPLTGKGRKLVLKAQADLRARNIDDCFQDLDQAMKVSSAIPYVHGVRGAAYLLSGRLPEAILELQQAVQVLPLPANYSNLGYAYLLNGDSERGEQQLRQALELHNPQPQTRYLMGLLLMDRRTQIREACEVLQQAQNLMPAARVALAVCYVRDGRDDAANGQIRDVLGAANASKYELLKKWVALVAAQPKPSAAFGLHIQVQTAQK